MATVKTAIASRIALLAHSRAELPLAAAEGVNDTGNGHFYGKGSEDETVK
jgi:hypothetical protein